MRNIKINWRYNIGQRLIEYNTNGSLKKDITIIDRKIIKKSQKTKNESLFSQNIKYYKYKCNICGFDCGEHYRNQKYNKELWIIEAQLIIGCGCGVCCNSPQTVVEGINDIPTTAPWMVKYFQGGYDEAKLYNKSSGKKIYPVCPDCGRVKDKKISINTLYSSHSISCYCSDCIPYGEKIMSEILNQLRLNFQTQLTKSTFKWCNKYRYDFYFEYKGEQYICEVHGMQHYEENTNFKMSLKEVQENDRLKKELALNNGVKEGNYIVIDCRKSELDFIKQNILDSDLANIFDFSRHRLQEISCCRPEKHCHMPSAENTKYWYYYQPHQSFC